MKGNNDNELELIKDFITKINNGKINNKDSAARLKQDRLKQDLIKDLEKYIFPENIKQKRTFAPSSPPKEDYSAETNKYLKYQEE